jgi:hypothetical protein
VIHNDISKLSENAHSSEVRVSATAYQQVYLLVFGPDAICERLATYYAGWALAQSFEGKVDSAHRMGMLQFVPFELSLIEIHLEHL